MIRLVLLMLVICGPATAETITIRSGWQPAFTRLVFAIPEGANWSLAPDGGNYRLSFPEREVAFDLAGVFERIPRARLAALTPRPPHLTLQLACACEATAFLWRPDRLVVDIKDAARPRAAPADAAPTTDPPLDLPVVTEAAPDVPPAFLPSVFREPEAADPVQQAETALVESVARAASQGLLSMEALPPDGPADAPPPPQPPDVSPAPEPDTPGLAAHTSLDAGLATLSPLPTGLSHACPPAEWFHFPEPDGQPFHAHVAAARQSLVGEFGDAVPAAAMQLARTYLRYGFGAEAIHVLGLTETGPEADAVQTLAALLDGTQLPPGRLTQPGCDAAVDVWSILAGAPAESAARNDTLQAFARLPPPVRARIGGRLAARFLAAGDEDAADTILAMERQQAPGETTRLVEAELAGRRDGALSEIRELTEALRNEADLGPGALLELYDLHIAEQRPLPADIRETAAGLVFRYRDRPEHVALVKAGVAERLMAEDPGGAMALLELARPDLPDEALRALMSDIVVKEAEILNDSDFLARVLPTPPRPLDAAAENAVARRLLDLQLPEAALSVLTQEATRDDARARRYLEAEAALQSGRLETMEAILGGLSDPAAQALRARAREVQGDFVGAFENRSTRPDEFDPDAAWRAGALERLVTAPDAVGDAARRHLERPPAEPVAESELLASSRKNLADAEEARRLAERLLAQFDLPAEPTID
ncbi:hypothetical protein OG2516_09994 [Oceanicola granulosus HTCC2516]|uniref:Topo IA-type catalytic domain-containing protein n=1 Tax=Oceanicola granulosus (strain ATCC BAA-861 / DSM 15982 / KCTC 12143 / HTCC2516) TaxID=314256 RepID=Q2CDI5_OCEGH|nr:hypothetical protein [Oceanicola granulosus]EAR50726.1 hypothetical protein OG2516_09994 [Oceanicola granulosus HTCC2516]